jgi:transporter family protein
VHAALARCVASPSPYPIPPGRQCPEAPREGRGWVWWTQKSQGTTVTTSSLPSVMKNGGNYAKVKSAPPQPSSHSGGNVGKIYSTWIMGEKYEGILGEPLLMSTTILSILCGIGGMFGWGIYDFLGGVYTKQIGSLKSFFWSQLAGLISVILLTVVLTRSLEIPILVIILLPVAAILYSVGYLFFFKGFEIGNVSIVAATMNLWAVFTMLFAFIFLGQRLSTIQSLGVLMIISGVTLASLNLKDIRNRGFQLSSGVKEAIIGAFFFGVFWNISEIISEDIGWLLTTLFVKLGIILFLLLFSLLAKRKLNLSKATNTTKWIIILMGIIEAGAVAIVNYGLTIGEAILITPIASALSIVTITLAIIFLKEKITKLQGFGMIIAIAGIIVTAF